MTPKKRLLGGLVLSLLVTAGCGGSDDTDYGASGTSPAAGAAAPAPSATTPDSAPAVETPPAESAGAAAPEPSSAAPSGATSATTSGASPSGGGASKGATSAGGKPGATSAGGKPGAPSAAKPAAPSGASPAGRTATGSAGSRPGQGSTSGAAPTPAPPGTPAPTPAAGGPKGEIRLGSFGVESGPLGNIMLPIFQGAKAWVADVNARGGLNGHPVKLFMADDGGDPNRTVAIARRLVEQDKIQAVYATHAISTLYAALPYFQQVQVPVIGGCPCQDDPMDETPIAFPLASAKEGLDWAHLASFLHYSKEKKVAIIYCRESPSCARITKRIEPVLKQSGREVTYKAEASVAQPDYTAEIIAARNSGAGGVIAVMDFNSVIRITKTAHRQQWKPFISAQWSSFDERVLAAGGADIEGMGLSATVVPYTSPKMADYREALKRYIPGGILAIAGAHEWTVGKMLEIIAKGFPANPTSKDFIEGLYSLRGETIGGRVPPITYSRDQGHGNTHRCVIPVQVQGGQFVPAGDDVSAFSCPPGFKPSGA